MTVSVKVERDPEIQLKAKRSLDGNIMIFDHEDIDIILMLEKNKCLAFPKENMNDKVYYAQDKMFKFLSKKGVIDPSSIRGGNIYGSMEASILKSKLPKVDPIQATLYSLYEFMQEEKPYFMRSSKLDLDQLGRYLRPDDEHSTDLGDVPHGDAKGSLDSRVRPYGFRYNYSLLREEENE